MKRCDVCSCCPLSDQQGTSVYILIIFFKIFVIPKHFAFFYGSFWFGSGSTLANTQWGSQPNSTLPGPSKLNLFLLIPTEIVANRWGKRSFLPTSTFNANLQNLFYKAILSQRWGKMIVFQDMPLCPIILSEFRYFVLKYQQLLHINNVYKCMVAEKHVGQLQVFPADMA